MTSCCTSLPWFSPLALSFQPTVISPTRRSGFGDTEWTRQTLGHHLLALSQRLYVLSTRRDCEHEEKEFDFYFLCPRTTKTVLRFIVCHNTLAWRHFKKSLKFLNIHKNRIVWQTPKCSSPASTSIVILPFLFQSLLRGDRGCTWKWPGRWQGNAVGIRLGQGPQT